jgi:succinate dehydrogenase hydrophobic anchor subunit
MAAQHSFFKRNGLLSVFLIVMLLSLAGQAYTGWNQCNEERLEKDLPTYTFTRYLTSGHFIQATFENWESEFLQMGMYVFFTVFLYQQGSAESKSLDEPEAVDREPIASSDAPWPVKKGGWILKIYKNSLSLVFVLLFAVSFVAHAYGTMRQINEEEHKTLGMLDVLEEYRFWFESLQNWQSEFLSVAAIVFFSIYLRQKGSPESRPVDAPHGETGK